jgi:uncharacterized membrane protein YfcA
MEESKTRQNPTATLAGGAVIGTVGGLIGLGGAEFRLPLLIGVFRFAALEAIILNKAMSLIVVASALVFRTKTISVALIAYHLDVVANLLAGSLIGALAWRELGNAYEERDAIQGDRGAPRRDRCRLALRPRND